jgi:hypothetical protein
MASQPTNPAAGERSFHADLEALEAFQSMTGRSVMKHFTPLQPQLIALSSFLIEHAEALINAAGLLGGAQAIKQVAEIIRDLPEQQTLPRRLARKLEGLQDLLTLEHVADFDSFEAEHFARINPEDPVVAEICWLTAQFTHYLGALRYAAPNAVQVQPLAA